MGGIGNNGRNLSTHLDVQRFVLVYFFSCSSIRDEEDVGIALRESGLDNYKGLHNHKGLEQ